MTITAKHRKTLVAAVIAILAGIAAWLALQGDDEDRRDGAARELRPESAPPVSAPAHEAAAPAIDARPFAAEESPPPGIDAARIRGIVVTEGKAREFETAVRKWRSSRRALSGAASSIGKGAGADLGILLFDDGGVLRSQSPYGLSPTGPASAASRRRS
jgi:hypothetical protein